LGTRQVAVTVVFVVRISADIWASFVLDFLGDVDEDSGVQGSAEELGVEVL
jgi:hypothetical protein